MLRESISARDEPATTCINPSGAALDGVSNRCLKSSIPT